MICLEVEVPEATAVLGMESDEVETVIPSAPSVALPMVKPEWEGGGGEGGRTWAGRRTQTRRCQYQHMSDELEGENTLSIAMRKRQCSADISTCKL